MEYPKINSLYKREGCGEYDEKKNRYVSDLMKKPRKSAIIEGEYACDEFPSINKWSVTEKIDGTNVRILFNPITHQILFKGRTENAQFPTFLYTYLKDTFTLDNMFNISETSSIILFGEGYGPKIQSGGYYRNDVSFILFDVLVDEKLWLNREDVIEIADKLNIKSVPLLARTENGLQTHDWTLPQIVEYVKSKPNSTIAQIEDHEMEGIVARSNPQIMFRSGGQIMFKLKCKDFYEKSCANVKEKLN